MNAISGTAAARSRRTDGDGDGGGVLVDRRWLAAHLGDPHVRVVEVDVGPAAHTEWHIDGAVLWNVYGDLKDADYRTVTEAELERLVGRSGIDAESIVVCYGCAPALGFWLLKLLGHRDVRILDCSRDAWRADGLPWTTADGRPAGSGYRGRGEATRIRADLATVRDAVGRPGARAGRAGRSHPFRRSPSAGRPVQR